MAKKAKKKKQSLGEKYNLGKPRKREKLSKEEKLFLAREAEKHRHILKMGELFLKTENRRYGNATN